MSAKHDKMDNPTAVIGALAKTLQNKYGEEALDLLRPILREYGFHGGDRLKKKMADKSFTDRVEGWLEPIIKTGLCVVVEKSEEHVTVRGLACPLNLEGSNQALCDACMSIDIGLVSALAEKEITIKIDKSMARGDECCLVTFRI
jgi:hypothetical protein